MNRVPHYTAATGPLFVPDGAFNGKSNAVISETWKLLSQFGGQKRVANTALQTISGPYYIVGELGDNLRLDPRQTGNSEIP